MVVKQLAKVERDPSKTKIMGLDTSTTGIAWTSLFNGDVSGLGKIVLKEKEIEDKLATIYVEWKHLLLETQPDHVFVEKSIFVKNPDTARKLSFVVGTIAAITRGEGYEVTLVEPGTWKAFMGYHNLSNKFTLDARLKLGQKEGKKYCDKLRKSQTWRVIKHNYPYQVEAFDFIGDRDNDIADSWGIALYGHDKLVKELNLEKGKDVSLDLEDMERLGLVL